MSHSYPTTSSQFPRRAMRPRRLGRIFHDGTKNEIGTSLSGCEAVSVCKPQREVLSALTRHRSARSSIFSHFVHFRLLNFCTDESERSRRPSSAELNSGISGFPRELINVG